MEYSGHFSLLICNLSFWQGEIRIPLLAVLLFNSFFPECAYKRSNSLIHSSGAGDHISLRVQCYVICNLFLLSDLESPLRINQHETPLHPTHTCTHLLTHSHTHVHAHMHIPQPNTHTHTHRHVHTRSHPHLTHVHTHMYPTEHIYIYAYTPVQHRHTDTHTTHSVFSKVVSHVCNTVRLLLSQYFF